MVASLGARKRPATHPAGTRVWFSARWRKPRGISGPECAAVGVVLGGGGVPQTPAIATLRKAA